MNLSNPLLPAVAMVAVTAAVWVRLYVVRIDEFRRRGIPPQSVATSKQLGEVLQEFRAADNFRNLFEAPVLFYALCLAIGQTGVRSGFFEAGCWTYVLLRALHSLIHCTYNRVMHRFLVYSASTLLLFVLWADLGVALLRH